MGKFSDHPVNRKFKHIYEELIMRNLIKSKSDLAKNLETYNHIINNILKGDRNITVDQIRLLSERYDVRPDFLFGQTNAPFQSSEDLTSFDAGQTEWNEQGNISLIPVRAAAGYQIDLNSLANQEDTPKFSLPDMSGELFAFEIDGDSMMPTITNGDIIVCEKVDSNEPLKDNQVYVIISDVVVAKRIHQIKDDHGRLHALELISDNHSLYPPYQMELEEIRQMLKVKCRLTTHGIN